MAGRILDIDFPQVAPSGATSARGEDIPSSPAMFGGLGAQAEESFGQGLTHAGIAGIDYAQSQQNRLNAVDASDRLTRFTDAATDENAKFMQLSGRAAMDARPAHNATLRGLYDDAIENASNPAVKAMLAESAARNLDRYYSYAADHAAREESTYSRTVAKDNTLSRTNQAVWAYRNGDYTGFESQRQHALAETRNFYELEGYESPQIDAEVAKTNGKIILDTTKLILDHPQGGVAKAEAFAKRYENEIDAPSNLAVDTILKSTRAVIDGQHAARSAMAQGPGGAQSAAVAGVPANFIGAIKSSEGFDPRARWDYKQFTNGYGTRATHSAEVIDRDTADRRFEGEITRAASIVDGVNPNLDAGTRAALTSLTFNAGSRWTSGQLGQAVRAGDLGAAKALFVQYDRAGGAVNQGLADRRAREAAWFGQDDIGPSAPARQASYAPGGGGTAAAGAGAGGAGPIGEPAPAAAGTPTPAAAGSGSALLSSLPPKSVVEQRLLDDPDLQANPQKAAAAWSYMEHAYQVVQGQAADEERARRLAEQTAKKVSDDAELAVMSDIYSTKPTVTSAQIIAAGQKGILGREAVERLLGKLREAPGAKDTNSYGPGFWEAYQAVHAEPGDPGRITDPAQLYRIAGPHGALTVEGVDKLKKEIAERGTAAGKAETDMLHDFFEHVARPQISTTMPDIHRYDVEGERRYLSFMAAAFSAYEGGKTSGKTAMQLLTPESPDYIGKLIERFKPPESSAFADSLVDKPAAPGIWSKLSPYAPYLNYVDPTGGASMAAGAIGATIGRAINPEASAPFDPARAKNLGELQVAVDKLPPDQRPAARAAARAFALEHKWVRPNPVPDPAYEVPISR
jgi:lysozyme